MLLTGTNQYTWRKKKTVLGAKTLSTTNPTRTGLGSKADVFCKTPTTIRVSRGKARITGRIHNTIWFFCFSVKLRIDELCKQPEKLMVHLYPAHKSGILGVLKSSQWGVLRNGNKPHLTQDLTNQTFPFEISIRITTHTIQRCNLYAPQTRRATSRSTMTPIPI